MRAHPTLPAATPAQYNPRMVPDPPPVAFDFRRVILLALAPQAALWALVMVLSTQALRLLPGGDRVLASPLGSLAALGEPAAAVAIVLAALGLGIVLARAPGAPRRRALAIQALGLAFTLGLVVWSQVVLGALPFLAGLLDALEAWGPWAWAILPLAFALLLAAYLYVLGAGPGRPFPTGEFAHTFVLVAALDLPFVPWAMDPRMPLDLAVLWSGSLPASFFGALAAFVLELAWRKLPQPHARFGPWFILAVSSLAAFIAIRRMTYVFGSLAC